MSFSLPSDLNTATVIPCHHWIQRFCPPKKWVPKICRTLPQHGTARPGDLFLTQTRIQRTPDLPMKQLFSTGKWLSRATHRKCWCLFWRFGPIWWLNPNDWLLGWHFGLTRSIIFNHNDWPFINHDGLTNKESAIVQRVVLITIKQEPLPSIAHPANQTAFSSSPSLRAEEA